MSLSHLQIANIAILAGLAIRLGYWLYVDPIWEDALITLRIVGNFVTSGRLSYNLPEVVYGFTSPLHALLIMLPGEAAFPGGGLFTSRIASLVAFGATVRMAMKLARHPAYNLGLPGCGLWLLLLVCYMPGVYFPLGGMETQFAVLAVIAAITYCTYRSDLLLGIWLGIALLVRPDLVILLIACLSVRFLGSPKAALKVGLVACVVYGPWFAFSWMYFGSPIPQTVIAKSLQRPEISLNLWWFAGKIFSPTTSASVAGNIFLDAVVLLSLILILASIAILCLSPNEPGPSRSTNRYCQYLGKAHLLAGPLFVIGFYFYMTLFMAHCPWYHVPVFLLSGSLFALTVDRFAEFVRARSRMMAAWATAVLTLGIALPHVCYAVVKPFRDHLVQLYIENSVRIPVGLWLRDHVQPGERVFLEPLGYVGYYAGPGVAIDDWPGLVSRRTTTALRSLPPDQRTEIDPIPLLKPEWIVIRQGNYRSGIAATTPAAEELRDRYQVVAEFGIPGFAPDYFFLQNNMDAFFYILRRV